MLYEKNPAEHTFAAEIFLTQPLSDAFLFSQSSIIAKEVSSRNTSHKSYYSSYVPTLFLITSNVPSINKTPTGNEIHALLVNPAIT